jgi:hypothetical protein
MKTIRKDRKNKEREVKLEENVKPPTTTGRRDNIVSLDF